MPAMIRQYPTHTVTIFEVVKLAASKSCKCTVCGKRMKRSYTFEGTINPFNTAADGGPKSRAQVLEDLKVKAERWKLEPETHQACTP